MIQKDKISIFFLPAGIGSNHNFLVFSDKKHIENTKLRWIDKNDTGQYYAGIDFMTYHHRVMSVKTGLKFTSSDWKRVFVISSFSSSRHLGKMQLL